MRVRPTHGVRLLLVLLVATLCTVESEGRPKRRRAARRAPVRRTLPAPPPTVVLGAGASAWDHSVAEAARRALTGRRGAVVAMDPRNGRVLAVVNPEEAVAHAYQPCSVFKIVVAIAGLSEGVIQADTTVPCRRGACWFWPGHGPIDLRRALAVSCNPYFQWVGEQLGYEVVQRYAQLLGLGEPTGINLPGETAGSLPLSVAPARVALLSSHAAGIATSPVQLAVLISAAINGGVVFTPRLAGPAGFVPQPRWRLPRETVFDGLADGFLGAVNEGSATSAFDSNIMVAGKTGTCARVGWFASYAPADEPEIVLVTFVRPGSGHTASAVAGRIYQDLYHGSAGRAAMDTATHPDASATHTH